jgi:endonuclease YncB( thermonuclease family)
MTLISSINRLFILLLLSIGATSPSYAGFFDDWTDNQLCEWMDQPSPPMIIKNLVNKRKIICSEGIASEKTKTAETPTVETSDSDPTVSKVIEVIQGDKFIVDIAEPHELAGTNINLNLRDVDAPDAVRSCPKQLEFGIKVKDIVTQKLADASSIKLKNYRKTSKAIIAQVFVDGKDLGAELVENGYASDEYGHWKAYFCSALHAIQAGNQFQETGDYEKAIFWYERALVLDPDGSNNSQATYDLSMIYMMYGDDKKSLDYLKQSAELGYTKAEEDLGAAYMNGNGVSKNLAQAKKWLKKAHEHGSGSAEDICGCKF